MSEHSGFRQLVNNRGFQAFLWTQFFGAFNDNIYKMIVSLRAVHVAAGTGASSLYLALSGAVFVLPFLLFSGYSGHLADAVSKRTILISVKVFEIFVMALHSTIFSPAKYGIVPEMLPDRDLSRANALLEMSTFVAIVLGTLVGSSVFTTWKDQPWKMGVVMLAVAGAGFATSFKIARVPLAGST